MKENNYLTLLDVMLIATLVFGLNFLLHAQAEKILPEEVEGHLIVEAENFDKQELTEVRKWEIMNAGQAGGYATDPDSNHYASASNFAYLEILPDTRTNHDEKLVHGVNFSNEPGKLGILHYHIKINNPGRYYVWVRAYSTGTEDNGIHVGLDGEWPESGQRMQWCEGKNQWTWGSRQRTAEVHCGVEQQIYLDIETPGVHTVMFSMREDGFEFDQWALTKEYTTPE